MCEYPELAPPKDTEAKAKGKRREAKDGTEDVIGELIGQIVERDQKNAATKQELRLVRAMYQELLARGAGQSSLLAAICDQIASRPAVPVPAAYDVGPVSDDNELELVLMLGCWHIGEIVDAGETVGIGQYDLAIARARALDIAQQAIRYRKERLGQYRVTKLHVVSLGDMMRGLINGVDAGTVRMVTQLTELVDIMTEVMMMLAMSFERIEFTAVPGNHGLSTMQEVFKGKAKDNYDTLAAEMLRRILAQQPNIRWHIPVSPFAEVRVGQATFLAMHGDSLKALKGLPQYGMREGYLRLRAMVDQTQRDARTARNPADPYHLVTAHFHDPMFVHVAADNALISVGSLVGGNELGINAVGDAKPPSQTLISVSPQGHITDYWPLRPKEVGV
ncbi:MAG TPA: hypothetical protein VGH44_03200 [Candidatus Saccharimonadia bacterium]